LPTDDADRNAKIRLTDKKEMKNRVSPVHFEAATPPIERLQEVECKTGFSLDLMMINPHPLQPTIQTCNVHTTEQEIRERGFEETDGRLACRMVRDEVNVLKDSSLRNGNTSRTPPESINSQPSSQSCSKYFLFLEFFSQIRGHVLMLKTTYA